MATSVLHARDFQVPGWRRWCVLGGALLFFGWSLLALYWPRATTASPTQEGGKDLQAYRRIVERVHDGEGYYSAAAEELKAGGYASSSIFNWRLPTYAWLLAAFPRPEWGQALLALVALAALALAYAADCQDGGTLRSLVLVVVMAGAFLWCIDGDAFFSQELWAGVLIAVSVSAARNKNLAAIAVASGLGALWLRELALPYVLVALVLAWRQRHWRETAAWCGGIMVFAGLFGWHAWQVQQHLTGSEFAESEGWIQFGGPAFVVATCKMNIWLFNLPAWVALVYLIGALVGLTAWREPGAVRVGATICLYLAAFLVLGKPFNAYWGLLFAPLLPIGLVRLPEAWRSCQKRGLISNIAETSGQETKANHR